MIKNRNNKFFICLILNYFKQKAFYNVNRKISNLKFIKI